MGLDSLPDDVVAVPMTSNAEPLRYQQSTNPNIVMTLREKTHFKLVFSANEASSHSASSIGAILSQNREEVYWVNDTNPLP